MYTAVKPTIMATEYANELRVAIQVCVYSFNVVQVVQPEYKQQLFLNLRQHFPVHLNDLYYKTDYIITIQ